MTHHNKDKHLFPEYVRIRKSIPSPWELEKQQKELDELKAKIQNTATPKKEETPTPTKPPLELIENHDGEMVAYPSRMDA